MPRQAKDYKYLNCKVDRTVFEKLDLFVEQTKLSKTATVEKALLEYIKKFEKTGKI